jgi:hypothetical protein
MESATARGESEHLVGWLKSVRGRWRLNRRSKRNKRFARYCRAKNVPTLSSLNPNSSKE